MNKIVKYIQNKKIIIEMQSGDLIKVKGEIINFYMIGNVILSWAVCIPNLPTHVSDVAVPQNTMIVPACDDRRVLQPSMQYAPWSAQSSFPWPWSARSSLIVAYPLIVAVFLFGLSRVYDRDTICLPSAASVMSIGQTRLQTELIVLLGRPRPSGYLIYPKLLF